MLRAPRQIGEGTEGFALTSGPAAPIDESISGAELKVGAYPEIDRVLEHDQLFMEQSKIRSAHTNVAKGTPGLGRNTS